MYKEIKPYVYGISLLYMQMYVKLIYSAQL